MNGRPVRNPTYPKRPPSSDTYVRQRGEYGFFYGVLERFFRIQTRLSVCKTAQQQSRQPYLAWAHGPIGCFMVKVCTSTKPAVSSRVFSCSSLGLTRPDLLIASSMARPHRMRAFSGVKVPSSLRHSTDMGSAGPWSNSINLSQLTVVLRKLDVSTWFHAAIGFREHFRPFRDALGDMAEVNEIEDILNYDQLCCPAQVTFYISHTHGNVHSNSTSSTSNLQFGGTLFGRA
jgi:hypothetical protein